MSRRISGVVTFVYEHLAFSDTLWGEGLNIYLSQGGTPETVIGTNRPRPPY